MVFVDRPSLAETTFVILRDLLHERLGLYYADDRRELLEDKLADVMVERNIRSFMDLYYALKYENDARGMWNAVTEALTVKETYFWREMDAVWALVRHILPEHHASYGAMPLRIWSAACATGEEPLTLAMAIKEEGWWDRIPWSIMATDVSQEALTVAKKGLYGSRSFRALPLELRDRYFDSVGDRWQVRRELLDRMHYGMINLADTNAVQRMHGVHVIYCRNVFIYFSDEVIERTAHAFYDVLSRPGYLFLGAAESLLRITTPFTLQTVGKAFVYVKN